VPATGDFVSVEIAGQPLLMVRQADGSIRVLNNRCAHKGMPLATDESGSAGKFFRCPYHAWTYKLDGSPLAIPLKNGYEGTRLKQCESGQGMGALKDVAVYRDFVFARINEGGPDFHAYFGEVLGAIDNLVDRSPTGKLRIEGGCIRNIIHCNWKMYLENINDTVHPLSAHESATQAAQGLWQGQPADAAKPMAMEQILPFGAGYDFFDRMGGRVYPNGHSMLGVNFSIHSGYAQVPEYEAALRAAHGEERTTEILQRSPQNSVCFPSLSVKSSPQAIRAIRPLAADRTLVEAWSFRAEGAPDVLFERSMTYNRLVFSPMSIVAHDDVHLFESIQQGLKAGRNEWVSLHRDFQPGEMEQGAREVNGTSELLMRNQFRAWAKYMSADMQDEPAGARA
jgi:phenylpropionate dioxygenase-like ring-hydroxylating dioxygenase large terminal subunit